MQRPDQYATTSPTLALKPQTQTQPPKALRFVTNYGAPHPKRRRIGAACLTCRKRKTACSGERPGCETCLQNKLDCAGYSEGGLAGHKRNSSGATIPGAGPDIAPQTHDTTGGLQSSQTDTSRSRDHYDVSQLAINPAERSTLVTSPRDRKQGDQAPDSLFSGPRNRMPYFRWLGPTAIMPGFKQMVVKVKRPDPDITRSSTDGGAVRSPTLEPGISSVYNPTPVVADSDVRASLTLPFYDTSPMPPSELITHLANTFFTHLGCNYPFLQRRRFMRDLEEKQVDAILVDAVCALAARFSTHPLLIQHSPSDGENRSSPAEYGHVFAQRAKTALVETFACPSVAAAQAALLLAYNEFGEQRDSGLWMYLGIAIRLAQDLGLQKVEGLKYVGKYGPTPKMVVQSSMTDMSSASLLSHTDSLSTTERAANTKIRLQHQDSSDGPKDTEEQKAVEQERVDTFWAIFFLDRVVSSGTGRPSTLRDKDIELSFPSPSEMITDSDWPAPFPALIRIVHLYGRVADQLNSIKEPSDITPKTAKRLATMEHQVTDFYQGLSPRLHFDAMNFQYYMKAGEGTNFVLLHFWFHTLIVLLHQPTLLKTFEGRLLQLFPNSQQLSMSSAKTIADILSYSQLMDAKAPLGNPFTTQPIYIAACAFLRETAERTASSNVQSRANTPTRSKDQGSEHDASSNGNSTQSRLATNMRNDAPGQRSVEAISDTRAQLDKHTLLATAASQHYQLCYKALQSIEAYWAGTKYILTVLDQKFEGVRDPLLYTVEERESSMEKPRPRPAFTSPGWRRKLSWGPCVTSTTVDGLNAQFWPSKGLDKVPGTCGAVDHSKAIGWTLTGIMNSPSTNLAWHYASGGEETYHSIDPRLGAPSHASTYQDSSGGAYGGQHSLPGLNESPASQRLPADSDRKSRPTRQFYSGGDIIIPPGQDPLIGFSAAYSHPSGVNPSRGDRPSVDLPPNAPHGSARSKGHGGDAKNNGRVAQHFPTGANYPTMQADNLAAPEFTDMMIESQDVDMNLLGLDMMPWFNSYSSEDMMGM